MSFVGFIAIDNSIVLYVLYVRIYIPGLKAPNITGPDLNIEEITC